jgi:non-ribosomal peptide synthetase-like protein
MLGASVGRQAFIDTTDLTEFDLVRIGDDAALNDECAAQTHLFEDRIMKTGAIEIGDRVVLGPHAIALYGSHLEDDSCLGPLSLAMKGERLPAGTSWMGSPARLVRGQTPGRIGQARAVVCLVGLFSTWHLISAAATVI